MQFYISVIRSFTDRETRRLYDGELSRTLLANIQNIDRGKLFYLNNVHNLQDLITPPGNCLDKLSGSRYGQHSIRVNNQWRICIYSTESLDGNADGADTVETVDYH